MRATVGRGHAGRLARDDLARELARQDGAFHRAEELLSAPVAGQHEVIDGCLLRRAELASARDCGVDGAWYAHDGELAQARQPRRCRLRRRGACVGCDLCWEEPT